MLMITPKISAGKKPHVLFSLFSRPIAAPASAIPTAIGKCRIPSGKPLTIAVAKCPSPATSPPSIGPKSNATMNPGAESKARLPTGLGILMSEPAALRAVKIASLAARMAGEVRIKAAVFEGFLGSGIIVFSSFVKSKG